MLLQPMARRPTDLLELNLPEDLERDTDSAIIQIVKQAVRGNADRDTDLQMLRDQLQGVSQPTSDGPWPNSCMLQDPTPFEFHSTVNSNVSSAFRQKPWVTLEALRAAQEQVVQKIETLGNVEAELFGFGKALDTIIYNVLESRFAVCGVFYDTTETKRREVEQVPTLTEEGITVEPELHQFNAVTESFRFEPIDSWDFYLNPVAAAKVQDADNTIQRVWLTRSALRRGIQNEGFDEEAVKKLLKLGPTAISETDSNPRRDQLQLMGVNELTPAYYECFRVIGLMPELLDAEGQLRKGLEPYMDEDLLWMCCPAHNIVFKRTYSHFPVRPYAVGKAMGVDTELCGHSVVSALSALSDEITIVIRSIIDSVNATMDPQMKVPEHLAGWYAQKDKRQPGGILPYRGNDPNSIMPVTRDFQGLQLGFELMLMLYNRCAQIVAAQGANTSLGGKARKAAEIEFANQVIQNKYAVIVQNVGRMVEEIFRIYFAMRKHYTQGEVTFRAGAQDMTLTKDELDVEYRIIPHADADNASSVARKQNDMALAQFLMSNPLFMSRVQAGDWSGLWMLASRILGHMGVLAPEAFIGPQPQPTDPGVLLGLIMPLIQQGAQMGDQVAQGVMQVIQKAQETARTQGGMQVNPANAVVPATGLHLPAIPSSPGTSQTALSGANGSTT